MKNGNGITLIALVITIVVLLILAAVTINLTMGENGLFNITKRAMIESKISEIEELANISYISRKTEEYTGGRKASIESVIADLISQGQAIRIEETEESIVKEIVLGNKGIINDSETVTIENGIISININDKLKIGYTYEYERADGVKYYLDIEGRYYEITQNEVTGKIVVEKEGIELGNKIESKKEVTAIAEDGTKVETEVKGDVISIKGIEKGTTVVEIKEAKSGKTAYCVVTVEKPITGITVGESNISIEKGTNTNLIAIITPEDTTEEAKWSSSNEDIVRVDEDGNIIGIEKGTATITVSNKEETIKGEYTVEVKISVEGISLNKSSTTINKGSTETLIATLTPEDTTDEVTWESSNKSVAEVDNKGKVTALNAGTATITATCGGETANCTVEVEVPTNSVTIQKEATVEKGKTIELTATISPGDTTDDTSWVSGTTSKATVVKNEANKNKASVTGIGVGTSRITVTSGGKSDYCDVTVTLPTNGVGIAFGEEVKIPTGKSWDATKVKAYSDGEGNTIPVPIGFIPVTGTKATGFVVKNSSDNNEFVWIPVEGMSYSYARVDFGLNSGGYSNFSESLPSDENTSVNTYGGFYMGRYEAGIASNTERSDSDISTTNTEEQVQAIQNTWGKPISQSGKNPYNYITRYQAQKLAEGLYNVTNNNVKSKLCSSYAWDTALKFIDSNSANTGYIKTSMLNGTIIGNYKDAETFTFKKANGENDTKTKDTEKTVTTGQTTPVNNIYDMGGNMGEFTTEATKDKNYPYSLRGGHFKKIATSYPVAYRDGTSGNCSVGIGFRITLYM